MVVAPLVSAGMQQRGGEPARTARDTNDRPVARSRARSTAAALLLRHGQSEWNASGQWQGAADLPLTALGRQQATIAADELASGAVATEFSEIWASDLRRAIETAEIIASELGIGEIRFDPRLREADAGPWEGLRRWEIDRDWPGFLDEDRRPDGFEPHDTVVTRATESCTEILRTAATTEPPAGKPGAEPATPLIVAHSGVIRAVRRHLGAADRRIPNLGGCWLAWDGTELSLGEMVALVDDTGPSMAPLRGHDGERRSTPAR